MKKYTLINNQILDSENKVLIESENIEQLQNLTNLLNQMQQKIDIDKTGSFSRNKLNEDFMKQKWNLIYIDVNNLKTINDSKGHISGDAHLVKVAKYLAQYGNVYRQGGDEFAVLCDDYQTIEKFEKENIENKVFSYGIVLKHEYNTMAQAYNLGDKRMYERKKDKQKNTLENKNKIIEY